MKNHDAANTRLALFTSLLAGSLLSCQGPGAGRSAGPAQAIRPTGSARQTFELVEQFGVAHPDQIVFFDLNRKVDAQRVTLVDGAGQPVPFQVMSDNRLAVRTDLPAGMTKTWRLMAGETPAAAGVQTVEKPEYYEIINELIGIRVPKAVANLTNTPAPIQGLRFQDGTWTAVGPNHMGRPAKSMSVEFIERGPLVTRMQIVYRYDTAPLHSYIDKTVHPNFPDLPAGEGPYRTTIEIQAGQPSLTFEEECATDIAYKINITNGLTPDKAQYRGHHASAPDKGMNPDGTVYNSITRDALVNLNYDSPKERFSKTTYPFLSKWDPWAVDTGWYWQLYDSRTNGSENLFGIFAGPASRLINPGLSGVSFDTDRVESQPRVSLKVGFQRLMPTQQYSTHMRFGWGIFLGKKSVDVKPTEQVQGINRQLNLHSGVNLNTIDQLPLTFPDPQEGYGTLYAPVTAWQGVAQALREEKLKGGRTFYGQQYGANPYLGTLLEYWANPTADSAKKAADDVNNFAKAYLNTLINGEGIYQQATHYWMGGARMSGYLIWMDQLLASDQLAEEEKLKLKRSAALFATALWDNDISPMQEDCGMNWGPANMSSMLRGTRYTFGLYLANHPNFRDKVAAIRKEALGLLYSYTGESGACCSCAHYTSASMVPILNLLQQMQMRGITDAFATEKRLTNYAEWEMQLATPPEVRFGGSRKIISVGDGCTEMSVRLGQIGTGFAKANPELSARLMGLWQAMGKPQDNFYGASLLKIDASLPAVSPKLGDAQFDGWMAVLRAGWETPDESAVFFINGDVLSDHRHNDQGEVILYALGAPLSLDFGSYTTPRASGGLMHSIALPEAWLGRAWDADHVPLDIPDRPGRCSWWQTQAQPLVSFRESASVGAQFTPLGSPADLHWQRTVRFLHSDPAHPVIVIDDAFTGKELAGKPVISTLNLMAQGAVATPAGHVAPVERIYPAVQILVPDQLPSAGRPFELPAGLNQFGFTGQWLIDWDLYTDAATPMQAYIGNWGHKNHPTGELNQFAKAQGKPFEERQHILRLRGQDKIRTIILPYRKGERPDHLAVTKQGAGTVIHSGTMTVNLTEHGFVCENGASKNLTSFDTEPVEAFGVKLSGGPAEVRLTTTNGTLVIVGGGAPRTIELLEGWSLRASDHPGEMTIHQSGRSYQVDVTRKKPVELMLERK